jgi:hypothetical protein
MLSPEMKNRNEPAAVTTGHALARNAPCGNKSARERARKSCAISAVCALSFLPRGRGIYGFRGWDGRPDAGGTSPAWLEVMG